MCQESYKIFANFESLWHLAFPPEGQKREKLLHNFNLITNEK